MAIQQQLNQLLYSANIGAGFVSQTPAFKEKRELKQINKALADEKEYKQAAARQRSDFLEEMGIGKEDHPFTPEQIDEIEAPLLPKPLHSPQEVANLKRRKALLDPQYRQEYYADRLKFGREKALEALEIARADLEDNDAFKSSVFNKETK